MDGEVMNPDHYAVRRELVLCRVPLPIEIGMVSRLLSAVAAEFDGVTIRQDGEDLVVVAPREDQ